MSERAAEEWQALGEALTRFVAHLSRSSSVNVNSASLRNEIKAVAQQYFRRARPLLAQAGAEAELPELDTSFQNLLQLADGRNAASTYWKYLKRVKKIFPRVSGQIEVRVGAGTQDVATEHKVEQQLLEALSKLVPSAALSYQQAIADLNASNRSSYRGPAVELREALREVLDHLAPDDDVMKSEGFKLEKDQTKPTMKQKVRFILRARGRSKATAAVPENTTTTIDAVIGDLARSVYTHGSVATHVATERRNVVQLKRYVEVVLHDILEL